MRARAVIRIATELIAEYGDDAHAYARAKLGTGGDRDTAGNWEQIAQAIAVITEIKERTLSSEARSRLGPAKYISAVSSKYR